MHSIRAHKGAVTSVLANEAFVITGGADGTVTASPFRALPLLLV